MLSPARIVSSVEIPSTRPAWNSTRQSVQSPTSTTLAPSLLSRSSEVVPDTAQIVASASMASANSLMGEPARTSSRWAEL